MADVSYKKLDINQSESDSSASRCRKAKSATYMKIYQKENRLRLSEQNYRRRAIARFQGLWQYGLKCACCGEDNVWFLTIDHINGRPEGSHKSITISGSSLWYELKRKGWPKEGIQLMCIKCNLAKGAYGECPHNAEQVEDDQLILEM